jgi:hypothetical protein
MECLSCCDKVGAAGIVEKMEHESCMSEELVSPWLGDGAKVEANFG